MIVWVVVAVAVVLVIVGALVMSSRRRPSDGVESFQRHIDALSPEARRRVVDRVQKLDDDPPTTDDPGAARGS
jgi:hypothetical protein